MNIKENQRLSILVACEESQAFCIAFRNLGHLAFSCDLQECRRGGHKEWHIKSDVTQFLCGKTEFITQSGTSINVKKWDLIIAHPPCTFLCKMSAIHLYKNANTLIYIKGEVKHVNWQRYNNMLKARKFFFQCLSAKADYIAVENPLPMAIAKLPCASTFVCPSWYGSKFTKKTLLWLKNLPPPLPAIIETNTKCWVKNSRGKYRSRTYPPMATEIAKQWSNYILNDKKQ